MHINTYIFMRKVCVFVNTHTLLTQSFLNRKVVALETDVINAISRGAEHIGSKGSLWKCQTLRSGQRMLRNSWKSFHLCGYALKMHIHNYTFSLPLHTSSFHPQTALFRYKRAVYTGF